MSTLCRSTSLLCCCAVVALLAAASCDDDDEATGPGPSVGASNPGGGGSGQGGAGASAGGGGGGEPTVCEPNVTEPCDCTEGVGSRRCAADGSGWHGCECAVYGIELAVSPDGNDSNAGTLAEPFATLGRAQQAVRDLVSGGLPEGGVVVWLREGIYQLGDSLALGAEDSGDEGRPVAWRGYPGERARWVGGTTIDPAAFVPVSSSAPIYGRLDPGAQAAVLELSLPSVGVTDYGELARRGFCAWVGQGPLELFVNDQPMTLARWPDAGENDLPSGLETADELDLFGAPSPDVSGHYVKDGETDGVSSFAREGLVGADQYYLHRYSWDQDGQSYRAWFLSTDPTEYPSDGKPFWYRYDDALFSLEPAQGAVGTVTTRDPAGINHGFANIVEAFSDTSWRYAGDRPSRWTAATDIWFHGFWRYPWADCHVTDATIDTGSQTITFPEPPGYGIVAGEPYYAYNIPEEITLPGEYWIDRATGMLYLWPPAGFASAEIVVSQLEAPLVTLSDASYVELHDLTLEAGRGELVQIDGGASNALIGLTLRNGGVYAGSIGGTDHRVRDCHVYGTGGGGFRVNAGDRPSLTAGGVAVENSSFHHLARWDLTYRPAVLMSGSGNSARHNVIHDLPHTAILFSGNDQLIELNVIHHVLEFSSDAGAIYTGRDWGFRGNVIRHNFIHHATTWFEGAGAHGIYLDDCVSGIRVEGNVLYGVGDYGLVAGGGRDNLFLNNIVARSGALLSADRRCVDLLENGIPNNTPGDDWNLLEKLQNVGYQDEPWASTYPACAAIPNDWATIIDPGTLWLHPEGCELTRNIGFGNGTWIDAREGVLEVYAVNSDNLEEVDPLFVDEAALDLSLAPGSPALDLPGWEEIPFHEMGIEL